MKSTHEAKVNDEPFIIPRFDTADMEFQENLVEIIRSDASFNVKSHRKRSPRTKLNRDDLIQDDLIQTSKDDLTWHDVLTQNTQESYKFLSTPRFRKLASEKDVLNCNSHFEAYSQQYEKQNDSELEQMREKPSGKQFQPNPTPFGELQTSP